MVVKSVCKWVLTGYNYGFVYHVVMWVVVTPPNKHATKHFKSTKHPIIRSFEPGETWEWCYVDKVMI